MSSVPEPTISHHTPVPLIAVDPVPPSIQHVEDVAFEGLIRRWTAQREWEWVKAANLIYGHVLDERETS